MDLKLPIYIDVILPLPVANVYTYVVPTEMLGQLNVGMRVIVPWGKTKIYTALVYSFHQNYSSDYQIKEIVGVLDQQPIVSSVQLKFWEWIASYYQCSLGEVFKAALPSGLKLESETFVDINVDSPTNSVFSKKEQDIVAVLQEKKSLRIEQLIKESGNKTVVTAIKTLLEKDVIRIREVVQENYKPRYENYIRLSSQAKQKGVLLFDELKRAKKQSELLKGYLELSGGNAEFDEQNKISKKQLLGTFQGYESACIALVEKQVFETYPEQVSRLEKEEEECEAINNLNEPQTEAFDKIKTYFGENKVVLLHGITSSGKTEIYIRLIQEAIEKGEQVLYLVPEIALTVQLTNRLKRVFGDKLAIYHSKFSDAERVEIYNDLLNKNRYQVILGVRSSVFLPFSRLGLIIVDEEHENSYKQYAPAPRYHARNASLVLANMFNSKVLLGTATPSLESYFNATTDKYALVELSSRYENIQMPEILVVDIQDAFKKNRMKSMFSWLLLEKMQEALANNEQVVLFQNRRGFSSFVECSQCGWVPKCKHCDVSLTYHKNQHALTCHYCGYIESMPNVCPSCGNTQIKDRGFGTEKVEEELKKYFPDVSIGRMDLDTTRTKYGYRNIINDFEEHKIDVLIGTQMVSKGLDFENVSVVGILNADNLFNYPDFRSSERAFQMLVQVSGRAGRKHKRGMVILQTFVPENPIVAQIVNNNYTDFFATQLAERKLFKYPPYYRIIAIYTKHKDEKINNAAVEKLAYELVAIFGNRVLGPDNPPVGRMQGLYVKKIMLKIENEVSYKRAKNRIAEIISSVLKQFKTVNIVVDVDPM